MIVASSEQAISVALPLKEHGYQVKLFPLGLRQRPPYSKIKTFAPQLITCIESKNKDAELSSIKELKDREDLGKVPLLYVQSPGSQSEMADYLNAGADDFIHSPFDPRVLIARAGNLLRREQWGGRIKESATHLTSGRLSIDLLSREATLKGKNLSLTRFEFDLLAFLLKNVGTAVARKEILATVWKYPDDVQTRTLDKHVETLRKKLGSESPRLITLHGLGYLIKPLNTPPATSPSTREQERLCLVAPS